MPLVPTASPEPGAGRSQPLLSRRLVDRAYLLSRWFVRSVLARHWKPLALAAALRTGGTLAQAASFLIAAQLLIHWTMIEERMPQLHDRPLLIGGSILFALLIAGSVCTYIGERLSVRTALGYERYAFAHAIVFVSDLERAGLGLSDRQKRELFNSGPRFMTRTILMCVGVGSAIVLVLVGLAACLATFPRLTAIIGAILVLSSPVFAYHALHATRVGHRFRDTSSIHMRRKKEIWARWSPRAPDDPDQIMAEAAVDPEYDSFLGAFESRLVIPPVARLIVNGVLAVSVLVSLLWIAVNVPLTAESVSELVVFLIFLRVFYSGAQAIVSSAQMIAAFAPNYLLYLALDPAMNPSEATIRDALANSALQERGTSASAADDMDAEDDIR